MRTRVLYALTFSILFVLLGTDLFLHYSPPIVFAATAPLQLTIPLTDSLYLNTRTGNLIFEQPLFSIPGRFPLELRLTHNPVFSELDVGFGKGWLLNYAIGYVETDAAVAVHFGSDRTASFYKSGKAFLPDAGTTGQLIQVSPSEYLYVDEDGTQFVFASPEHGWVTAIRDTRGYSLSFAYVGARLRTIRDSSDRQIWFAYAGDHVTSIIDPNVLPRRTLSFFYNDAAEQTQFIDSTNSKTQYVYEEGRIVSLINALGHSTELDYQDGRLIRFSVGPVSRHIRYESNASTIQLIDGDATVQRRYVFDDSNSVIGIEDGLGQRIDLHWAADGNLNQVSNSAGSVFTLSYDNNANLASIANQTGTLYQYTHDQNRDVTTVTTSDGLTYALHYDPVRDLIGATDADGGHIEFTRNSAGDVYQIIGPTGESISYERDAAGNLTSVQQDGQNYLLNTDSAGRIIYLNTPRGSTFQWAYDLGNRLTAAFAPGGRTFFWNYDAQGDLIRQMNADGGTIQYEYDELGRLIRVQDEADFITRYTLGWTGSPVQIEDALGSIIRYEYDAAGQITTRIDPLGNRLQYRYDASGNVISRSDANGQNVEYEYDSLGRLLRINYPDGSRVEYTYDSVGHRISMTDSTGTTRYEYDAAGHLMAIIYPDNVRVGYQYDLAGRLIELQYPDQSVITYSYNSSGQVSQVILPEDTVVYTYDNDGRLIRRVLEESGIRTDYSYDSSGELRTLTHSTAAGNILYGASYLRDSMGRSLSTIVTEADSSSMTYHYSYDAKGQLVAVSEPADDQMYQYDAVGNRVFQNDNGANRTYQYDDAHQLISITELDGTVTSFRYDMNGNRIEMKRGQEVTRYTYDYENRLVTVTDGVSTVKFVYNGDGIRVGKIVNGALTRYVPDGDSLMGMPLIEMDEPGHVLRHYSPGGLFIDVPNGERELLLTDHLGTPVVILDQSGTLERVFHDAFGVLQSESDLSTIGYTGKWFDSEVGLLYFGSRYYDPMTGLFLSRDFFPGQMSAPKTLHPYQYVGNDPINRVDPTGLMDWKPFVENIGNSAFRISSAVGGLQSIAGGLTHIGRAFALSTIAPAEIPAGAAAGALVGPEGAVVGAAAGTGTTVVTEIVSVALGTQGIFNISGGINDIYEAITGKDRLIPLPSGWGGWLYEMGTVSEAGGMLIDALFDASVGKTKPIQALFDRYPEKMQDILNLLQRFGDNPHKNALELYNLLTNLDSLMRTREQQDAEKIKAILNARAGMRGNLNDQEGIRDPLIPGDTGFDPNTQADPLDQPPNIPKLECHIMECPAARDTVDCIEWYSTCRGCYCFEVMPNGDRIPKDTNAVLVLRGQLLTEPPQPLPTGIPSATPVGTLTPTPASATRLPTVTPSDSALATPSPSNTLSPDRTELGEAGSGQESSESCLPIPVTFDSGDGNNNGLQTMILDGLCVGEVTITGEASVYSEPREDALLTSFLLGEFKVMIIGRTAAADWFEIQLDDGTQGWVMAQVIRQP